MPVVRPTPIPWRSLVPLVWQQALWAIPFALFFGTLYGASIGAYGSAYRISVVFSYSIGLALWATRHLVLPRLPQRAGASTAGTALEVGIAYGVMAMAGAYAAAVVVHFTVSPGFLGNLRAVAVIGMFSALFITLFGGIRFAMAYHSLALERARAVEHMRAELAQAELRALRAQIHPHFLFNTLNAIASLIASQPSAAEDVTMRLADLFRYTLRASEREHSKLGEELDFLRDYLAIERVRFGERLRVEEAIDPGLEAVEVPSLLLQPLVENAVRYAVAPRPEGGCIRLTARREGPRLVLEVADDGGGIEDGAPPAGTGFGLHAVRERLRAAGRPEALSIESTPERGTCVRITLPLAPIPPSSPMKGISACPDDLP
jgi:two-component sensor histidine kinase